MKFPIIQTLTLGLLLLVAGFGVMAADGAYGFGPVPGQSESHGDYFAPENETDPPEELDSVLGGTVTIEGEPVEGALVVVMAEIFCYDFEPWYLEADYLEDDFGYFEYEYEFDELDEEFYDFEDFEFENYSEEEWTDYPDDEFGEGADWEDWSDIPDEEWNDDWDYPNDDWDYYPPFPEPCFPELFLEYVTTDETGHFELEVSGGVDYQVFVAYSEELNLVELIEPMLEEAQMPSGDFPAFDEPYEEFADDEFEAEWSADEMDVADELAGIADFTGSEMVILPGEDWQQYSLRLAYREVYVDYDVSVEFEMELDEIYTILLPAIDAAGEEPGRGEDTEDQETDPGDGSDTPINASASVSGQATPVGSGNGSVALMALGFAGAGAVGFALSRFRPRK